LTEPLPDVSLDCFLECRCCCSSVLFSRSRILCFSSEPTRKCVHVIRSASANSSWLAADQWKGRFGAQRGRQDPAISSYLAVGKKPPESLDTCKPQTSFAFRARMRASRTSFSRLLRLACKYSPLPLAAFPKSCVTISSGAWSHQAASRR